jgi:hypothetical protein
MTKRLYQDWRDSNDWARTDRELDRADAWQDDRHPTPCLRQGCRYPAVSHGYCGLHEGQRLAEVSAENAKRGGKAA